MAQHQANVDGGISLVLLAPERTSELGLSYILRNKGRVQDSMRAMLATLRDNLDEEGRKLLTAYLDIRTAYATLYLSGPRGVSPEELE